MADPKTSGVFRARVPESKTEAPSGTNVKSIILKHLGRKESDTLTQQDLDNLVANGGFNPRISRQLQKAGSDFLGSGNDYYLQDDGNYNVYKKGVRQDTAGQKKGNKEGFNPGDLVGLGNNLSHFVGFAKGLQAKPTPSDPATTDTTAAGGTTTTGTGAGIDLGSEKKGGSETKTGTTTPTTPKLETSKPATNPRFEAALSKVKLRSEERALQGRLQQSGWAGKRGAQGTNGDQGSILDRVNSREDYDKLSDEEKAQYDEASRQKMKDFFTAKPSNFLIEPGSDKSKDARTNRQWSAEGVGYGMQDIGDKAYSAAVTGQFATGAAGMASKAAKPLTKFSRRLLTPLAASGQAYSLLGKAINPEEDISWDEEGLKALSILMGHQMNKSYSGVKNPPTKTSPRTKPTGDPARDKTIEEMSQRMSEGFRKGGKLPKAGTGMLLDPNMLMGVGKTPDLQSIMNPLANSGGRDQNSLGSVSNNLSPQGVLAGLTVSQPEAEASPQVPASELGARPGDMQAPLPGTGGKGRDWVNDIGTASKYIMPFVGNRAYIKNLEKIKPIDFKPVDLMTGTVRDPITEPTRMRYREPSSSDANLNARFRLAQDSHDNETKLQSSYNNALSRISQKSQVTDNMNHNKMFNAQQELTSKIYGNQTRAFLGEARANAARDPLLAAHHMLQTDLANRQYVKSGKELAAAEMIIKSGNATPEQLEWANKALGVGVVKRNGGEIPKGAQGMKLRKMISSC